MKKIAILAAALSALSVPAYAQSIGAGVSAQQFASAQQACAARGQAVATANVNAAGSVVVTCGRATQTASTQGGPIAGLGAGLGTGAVIAGVIGLAIIGAVVSGENAPTTTN